MIIINNNLIIVSCFMSPRVTETVTASAVTND